MQVLVGGGVSWWEGEPTCMHMYAHAHMYDIIGNPQPTKPYTHLSGYHADTPITIKAEPSIWPTAAFINIHEHPL